MKSLNKTRLVSSILFLFIGIFSVSAINNLLNPEEYSDILGESVSLTDLSEEAIESEVLGEKDENPIFFTVNVPSRFKKNLTAPNIIYSATGGEGVEVSEGQYPEISNSGVLSLQGLTGELLLTSGDGISINGLEVSNTLSFIGSGGTTVSRVGDAITVTSSTPDYTLSGWAKVGTSVGLTTATDSVTVDTIIFGNATITNGKSIKPDTDLGSDLGSSAFRFNNLYVGNINSNSSTSTAGQATFTYESLSTALTEASVLINPTAPVANGQLLGLSVAGYQRALIDEDGDLTLGYSSATSAPSTDVPLNIYGHSGTRVSFIDTGGSGYFAGKVGIGGMVSGYDLDVNGTTNIFQNSGGATPLILNSSNANSNILFRSSSGISRSYIGYDNIVGGIVVTDSGYTNKWLTINTTSGNVGIGIDTPIYPLHVAGAMRLNSYLETSSATNIIISATGKRILGFVTDDVTIDPKLAGADILFLTTQAGGNVGIGTDSPATKLDIASGSIILDYGFGLMLGAGGNGIYGDTADIKYASYGHSRFYVDNNNNDSSNFEVYGNVSRSTVTGALFTIEDTGNVGIGTTSPSYLFDVESSDSNVIAKFNSTATSGYAPASLLFELNDANYQRGMGQYYHSLNNEWYVGTPYNTGQAQYMIGYGANATHSADLAQLSNALFVIEKGGNVGIGIENPTEQLTLEMNDVATEISGVYSGIRINNTNSNNDVKAGIKFGHSRSDAAPYTPVAIYSYRDNGSTTRTAHLGFFVADNDNVTDADERMTIDENGFVGIGTTTPTSALEIVGAPNSTNGSNLVTGTINAVDNTALAVGIGGGIVFEGVINTVGGLTEGAGIKASKESATNATTGFHLDFFTREHGSNPNRKLRLSSTGGLSIGSTFSATSAADGDLLVEGNIGIGTTPSYRLHLKSSGSNTTPLVINNYLDNEIVKLQDAAGNALFSLLKNDGTESIRLRTDNLSWIKTGFNFGIGDSTPSYSLDITGMARATEGFVTYTKAGTISDTDFTETPIDGLMGVDSTNGRLYFRHGGAWHYVAQTAGFQIPEYETFTYDFNTSSFDTSSPLADGDFLIPFVERRMSDGAIHGLYTSFSDVKDQLFADELSRILSLEERVTALEAGGGLSTNPLLASSGSIGSIATWTDTLWTFLGKIKVGRDTAGSVVATTGMTTVQYDFGSTYPEIPAVYLTPMDSVDGSFYVKGISTTSFTVEMSQAQDHDVTFNWLAIIGSN